MATETVNHPSAAHIAQAGERATDLAYQLSEVSYQARAARALLHEFEGADADEGLVGVSYLLARVSDDCDRLSRASERASALPREATPAAVAAAGKPPALYDLDGELGARGKIAWEAAIQIEQCASTVRDLQKKEAAESDHVIALLLQRIEDLSAVIMSCNSADDTMENLKARLGDE